MHISDSSTPMILVGIVVSVIAGLFAVLVFILRWNAGQKHQRQSAAASESASLLQTAKAAAKKTSVQSGKSRTTVKKTQLQRHHPLDLNTLKGHSDFLTGICFTANGRGLATACGDQVVRVFKLDNASSKSFKFLRLNMPGGNSPTAVAFGEGASQLVIATQDISGASLLMYGAPGGKVVAEAKENGKLPVPEVKWEKHQVHNKKSIVTLVAATASYGSGDGSIIVASCSEGTDIKLWSAANGNCIGTVDTNQLKNTMATLSPDGRFLAAAAFTADVKVWEIVYGKDGSVREVVKVMQLSGHKSAVTWLCFTWDSERMITASKDGSIRIWNINVRYHLDEDPKCLRVLPIPLRDIKGLAAHYDRLAISPDNKILAVTHVSTLQWLKLESGEVLDTAENAHDGEITCIAWAPEPVPTDKGRTVILATGGVDKKVKLWYPPSL
eukprot:c26990_g1_i1 orf=583-1905(-)